MLEIPPLSKDAKPDGPRGKYVAMIRERCNIVPISADLRELFATERIVNDVLRTLASVMPQEPATSREPRPPRFPREECEQSDEYDKPTQIMIIHDDVTDLFPNERAVNAALRAAIELFQQIKARFT